MKKLLLYSLLLISPFFVKAQTFTEKDTVMTVAPNKTFKFTYRGKTELVGKNGVDSFDLCVIDYQGATEAQLDQYGDAALTKWGPLDYVHAGWNGGVTLGNGDHFPLIIHVSQQPPYGTNSTGWSWNIEFVKQVAQRFRIRTVVVRGQQKKSIALCGLSAGGDVLKSIVMYDTTFAKNYIASIWSVEGVYPDAAPLSLLQGTARAKVRAFFTDGGGDSWIQTNQRDMMNGAIANSADYYITTSGEAMYGHGNWNHVFGGNSDGTNRTPKVFPGSAFASGIAQTGYQWMYRQTDTTFATSGGGNPVSSAGPDKTIFYSNPTTTLDGTGSVDGNGTITSYTWTKISGPSTYNLTSGGWLIANATGLVQGVYGFKLSVTDNDGNTDDDTTYVTVQAPPTITTGANQQVNGSSATMAASSTDEATVVKSLVQILKAPGQPIYKIGFVGSSTGYGYGVAADSTIEYILNSTLQSLGLTNTNIVNLSVTSTDFWNALATGTPYPPIGHAPDTSKNLNALKARGCNIAINLFTTNSLDDPNLTWAIFYDAYKKYHDSANAMGMKYLQITPKTRDGFSPSEEQKLHDFGDSLMKYMPGETINVWDGFTLSPVSTATRPEMDRGDGVHWNGVGHIQAVKQIIVKLAGTIRELYPVTATITTPSSLTTTVTGMTPGTYTILVSSQDNDSLWNNATMTISDTSTSTPPPPTTNCNTGTPTVITLSQTAPGEIYIPDGGQGVNGLMGNDVIKIPPGNYDVISIGAINGDSTCPLKITSDGIVDTKIFRLAEHRNNPATHIWIHGKSGYGIKIGSSTTYQDGTVAGNPTSNGLAASYFKDLTIDSVEVRKTSVGMYLKPIVDQNNPLTLYGGWSADTLKVTNCYIHDIKGEGIYAGDTYPNADPYAGNAIPARLSVVELAYLIVDSTGWDGIQLSNARSGNRIHHNTITHFGLQNTGSQQAGIILGGNTTGDIDSNTVRFGTGNGIQSFSYGTINIYGNTIEAAGYDGTANGQQSYFGTDFNSTVETNPHKKVNFHDNLIIHPKYAIGVLRENADNSLTDSVYYVNNQFCYDFTPPGSWTTDYLMSAATATVRSGNTSISCGNNQAPTAFAGVDQIVVYPASTSTNLAGSGTDQDGTIASYAWTKTSGPAGGTITSASSASTTITSLQEGTYVFTLTVTDNLGATGADNVTVVVKTVTRNFKSNLQIKYKKSN